jgi:peptidoglycan/LPS O-acetylase OafA/YrhL
MELKFSKKTEHLQVYRPDIDGLRAVAVLSVILYHINNVLVPGGFVGVDIFFVISGYLITLHILRDMETGHFSLIEFYRRRIKRIFPVMLVVIAIVLLFSLVVFRPEDTVNIAQSGFASLFMMANVYFWLILDTNYFATASNEIPFLHLWTLGVEEQFYILWPLILTAIYRIMRGNSFFIIFSLIAASSFLLGEVLYDIDPSFVYYMLPTRAGELLIGALAAHVVIREGNRKVSKNIVSLSAILGLLSIGGALVFLSEEQVFPGLRAIPPTVGTALLILSGHYGNSLSSRLLTLHPLVWMGRISYSAYLWHWPLLAFLHYSRLELNLTRGVMVFILTILLSWISYCYIEQPARRYDGSAIRVFAFQLAIPASILVVLTVIIMNTGGYYLHWKSEEYKASAAKTLRPKKYDYVCQNWEVKPEQLNSNQCIVGQGFDTSPSVILWGDSNAAHYIGVLSVFAREAKFQFKNLEHNACPPINTEPDDFVSAKTLGKCSASLETMQKAFDMFQVFIISASWPTYQTQSETFLNVFFNTARQLASQGKLVILLGKVPVIPTYDRLCTEKAISLSYMVCTAASSVPLTKIVADVNMQLKNFASETANVEYYDIVDYLCPNGACSAYNKNGDALYYNISHLSLPGSMKIGNDIYQNDGVPFPFTLISDWPNSKLNQRIEGKVE